MEHQTATFIVNIGESLCAHELAHQWFGDKITCGSWKDIWLNEGFATHLTSIYMEKKYPANILGWGINEINKITSLPGGSVEVDDTTNVGRIFDGRLSYTKGSHLLYMLRWILGENVFRSAIKRYQTDPAVIYGFARTADLKRNLEKTSGKNLTYFFNEWFSGQGYPSYNVQWTNFGSGNVWIKMNQVTFHPSVSFFELPVALRFQNATQEANVVVDNTVNGETFVKSIGFIADTVFIDPEAWLITRDNSTQKLPAVLPVSLQNFSVTKNDCLAFINFSTSFESDMASFDIEFSNDGIIYSKVVTLNATGNSNSEVQYRYQFQMQPGKDYFFRLKMIERTGNSSYYSVCKVIGCNNTLTSILIHPNPVRNQVTISGLPAGINKLVLYNMQGQRLYSAISGAGLIRIDLSNFPGAMYMLRVQIANGNWIHKKIVKE
jgi:hypothetical protein